MRRRREPAPHGQCHVHLLVHVNERRTGTQGLIVTELRWQKWQIGYVYEQVQVHEHVGMAM